MSKTQIFSYGSNMAGYPPDGIPVGGNQFLVGKLPQDLDEYQV